MAVIVAETTGRESSGDKSSLQSGVVQTLTDRKVRTFRVSGVANDTIAAATSGIPQIDDPHPDDNTLLCIRVTASGVTPTIFDVRCEYEFIGVASADGSGLPGPSITWSGSLREEPTQFDINNVQLKTTAGEALDGTVSRVSPIVTLHYEFSSLFFNANVIFSHAGRINGSSWTSQTIGTVPAKAAFLAGVGATRQILTDTYYFRVTYDIAFRSQRYPVNGTPTELGWQLVYLNAGYMFKNAAGKLVNITDTSGTIPRGGPWLINQAGDDHSLKTPAMQPYFRYTDIYESADFTALGIP